MLTQVQASKNVWYDLRRGIVYNSSRLVAWLLGARRCSTGLESRCCLSAGSTRILAKTVILVAKVDGRRGTAVWRDMPWARGDVLYPPWAYERPKMLRRTVLHYDARSIAHLNCWPEASSHPTTPIETPCDESGFASSIVSYHALIMKICEFQGQQRAPGNNFRGTTPYLV